MPYLAVGAVATMDPNRTHLDLMAPFCQEAVTIAVTMQHVSPRTWVLTGIVSANGRGALPPGECPPRLVSGGRWLSQPQPIRFLAGTYARSGLIAAALSRSLSLADEERAQNLF